jgi:putative ABC transport system permease protein
MSDLRYALRRLIRSPGFTLVALLTLALGIGANTTAFTVLNRLLLYKLPYAEPKSLVSVWVTSPQNPYMGVSPGNFCDLRSQNTVFASVAVYYWVQGSLTEPGQPAVSVLKMPVSAKFFTVLGTPPAVGRDFTEDEEKRWDNEAIISNAFWRSRFAGDPKAIGSTIRLDGKVTTIIGVAPASLNDPMLMGKIDVWILDSPATNSTVRNMNWYSVLGRLKPGTSVDEARAALVTMAARFAHDFPKDNAKQTFRVVQYVQNLSNDTIALLCWLVLCVTSSVLAIVCVNLANLQLVRTTGRGREFAIRMALGSSRALIVRQILLESVLLSVAGGALGLTVAKWGNDSLEKYLARFFIIDFPFDFRVLAFAFGVSALTGAVFGVIPAWISTRADLNSALKQSVRGATSDRSRHRFRQVLIVSELALALVVLSGAGYFVTGMERILHRDLGWNPDNLLNGELVLSHDKYGEGGKDPRCGIFEDRLRAELAAVPGVVGAAISNGSPIWDRDIGGTGFLIDGQPAPPKGQEPQARVNDVSPGFFATYGMHILKGRDIDETDRPGSRRVAVISESMAKQFWPHGDPIGNRIESTDPGDPGWSEIVGIASDTTGGGDLHPGGIHYTYYEPRAQHTHRWINFTVRTATEAAAVQDAVRRAVAKVDSDVAISGLTTAQTGIANILAVYSIVSELLIEMAVLGLVLSGVGIYGVIANLAAERTQEIGIRMALGAQARDVLWFILRNGVFLASIGTSIGLALAFGLTFILEKRMPDVPGKSPIVVIGVAAILAAVSLVASWLPARKATRVDPLAALRTE